MHHRVALLAAIILVSCLWSVTGDYSIAAADDIIIWHYHNATDRNGVAAITLLVPSLAPKSMSPHLYVLPATAPVDAVFTTIHLNDCIMLSNGVKVPLVSLDEALTRLSASSLQCGANQIYVLQQFEREDPKMTYKRQARAGAAPSSNVGASETKDKEYPYLAAEILGNTIFADIQWLEAFIAHHWGPLHAFPSYVGSQDTGIYSLSSGDMLPVDRKFDPSKDMDEVRVAMSADWGAGTREADYVQLLMTKDYAPHYTIHIGDVYYVGTVDEVQSNVLGIAPKGVQKGVKWPWGSLGTFALNGNHEMYTRGIGYYDYMLPSMGRVNKTTGKNMGQRASFFALENAFWRVISLDTGYATYSAISLDNKTNPMPKSHVDWLVNNARLSDPTDMRPIIFVSHHQYYSAWEHGYDATPKQLASLLPANRVPLWLWGHEHRLSFYDKVAHDGINMTCYARCIGVGGFPTSIQAVPKDPINTRLTAYDNRLYVVENGTFHMPVGYNGFTRATFKGDVLQLDYYSLQMDAATGKPSNTNSTWLVTETFTGDGRGNIVQKSFTVLDKDITIVTHIDDTGRVVLSGDDIRN